MPRDQLSLFGAPGDAPEGLAYRPDFLRVDEEQALLAELERLDFTPFQFHGFEGKRRIVSFGWRYGFDGSGLSRAEAMPVWLRDLREHAEALAGLPQGAFEHALLIEYRPGAGIGWHRDRPQFGDVFGISLLSATPMRFRRRDGQRWERAALMLEPRSAYLLRGPARHTWEHSIVGVAQLRYSITFRTLARRGPDQL